MFVNVHRTEGMSDNSNVFFLQDKFAKKLDGNKYPKNAKELHRFWDHDKNCFKVSVPMLKFFKHDDNSSVHLQWSFWTCGTTITRSPSFSLGDSGKLRQSGTQIPKKEEKTFWHKLDVPTDGWQWIPTFPDSERFPLFLKWQKESLRLKMVLQWTISVQWRLKQGWSQQGFGNHPLLLLLWNFSSLDVGCCALNLFQLSLCKAQLQFHFSWENNFPFKAKPVHTFQYIQVSLFVQVLRPFTTKVVFAIFWGWMLIAKIKQLYVITYFFIRSP